jgi:hypothetical protein
MVGIAGRNRWMVGAAVLAWAPIPATAQDRQPPVDAAGAATAPTKPPIKINPRDVINVVDGLLNPKPKPTPTPTPTATPTLAPTGRPTATPTATPTMTPEPRPTATATSAPRPKPAPTAAPTVRPTATAVAEPPPESLTTETVGPVATAEPAVEPIAPDLSEPPPPAFGYGKYLSWIAALIAALAAGGYALKQWFRPKLAVSCEIETGASTLTASSAPALTPPDLAFTIRIEPGAASAPTGNPVLASGDPV